MRLIDADNALEMVNVWIFPSQSLNGILPGKTGSAAAAWTISTMERAHP